MLVVGDIHYPDRAKVFPQFLPKGNDLVVGTGDYTSYKSLLEIASYGKTFIGVKGNSDWSIQLQEKATFIYKGVIFGVYHGHNITPRGDLEQLSKICDELNCEVLLTGHTHKLGVVEYKGKIIANPGSASGAWGGSTAGEPKTALIVDVDEEVVFKSIGDVNKTWRMKL